jgi:hypothetical protein
LVKKKRKCQDVIGKEIEIDVPSGIIAHLTREGGGNVHDYHVVNITCGSFEKETDGDNSGAKNPADLEIDSLFLSAYRKKEDDIRPTKNNWICYDFKERRIVPTHYAIRTNKNDIEGDHLKSWLVETSVDGENWREVARELDNNYLNRSRETGTFAVEGCGACQFIRLVNIGRNHFGSDILKISAWEIFGSLLE